MYLTIHNKIGFTIRKTVLMIHDSENSSYDSRYESQFDNHDLMRFLKILVYKKPCNFFKRKNSFNSFLISKKV